VNFIKGGDLQDELTLPNDFLFEEAPIWAQRTASAQIEGKPSELLHQGTFASCARLSRCNQSRERENENDNSPVQ
jgi:hypothetical protein